MENSQSYENRPPPGGQRPQRRAAAAALTGGGSGARARAKAKGRTAQTTAYTGPRRQRWAGAGWSGNRRLYPGVGRALKYLLCRSERLITQISAVTENPRAHGGSTATSRGSGLNQKKKGYSRTLGITLKVLVLTPGPGAGVGEGRRVPSRRLPPARRQRWRRGPVWNTGARGRDAVGAPGAGWVRRTHLVCVGRYQDGTGGLRVPQESDHALPNEGEYGMSILKNQIQDISHAKQTELGPTQRIPARYTKQPKAPERLLRVSQQARRSMSII